MASLFLLPALLAAQQVPVPTLYGPASTFGVSTSIYNGQYVIHISDFGFFWLDTAALQAGHIQAISNCAIGFLVSDSDWYVTGDCNSITNVSSSGSTVLVRAIGAQCGVLKRGCGGDREVGHNLLLFKLGGDWAYLGDGPDESVSPYPDSTQTTDPQGRTWTIEPTDNTGRNYVWIASGSPSSTPVAAASATNLSAGNRADKTNYYGDKWQLQDVSSPNPTSVTWDFNYTGVFAADESGTKSLEGTVTGYFPCDPSGVAPGNIRSGVNCMQSLGLSNPPAAGSYRFASQSANANGPSATPFVSVALPVACPQVNITGYTGFSGTCVKSGGTLSVPTGGNADARNSAGNVSEGSFSWTFNFPSGSPVNLQGSLVPVPDGASGFALTIAFPGGYQARASGGVTFTQALTADFTTQSPVSQSSAFTVTNQMQKPATTTLNSVDSLIVGGSCGSPTSMPPNPLPNSFLAAGGTATLTAPSSAGGYCIYLRYNYTPQGSLQTSQTVSRPLTVTAWAPSPVIGIYLDSGKTKPASFFNGSFILSAGTPYYLFDEEAPPPAGTAYPGAQWSLLSASGSVALGSTAAQTSLRVSFANRCASGCALKISVGGATQQIAVNISSCAPNGTTLCLNDGRFNVQSTWTTSDGRTGAGQAVALTGDTGYFWFFGSSAVEVIVKAVDGRAVNSSFWIFAGGLTDVDVVLTVTDTVTGVVKTYRNNQGTAFQPIQDTMTFVASATSTPAEPGPESSTSGIRAVSSTEDAACTANATTLCLKQSRFKVQVQWTASDGRTGAGQAVPLTADTGYFWFFSPNNVEMVVKMVDGCTFNSRFWVFAGGLTDVNVVMTVTDSQTGVAKVYTNPQGVAFQPIQDTSAFATCP